MMNSLFCLPGYYLIEQSSPTSAGNNEWFSDLFLGSEKELAKRRGISIYRLADEMVESVAPSDQSIYFLPYVYGSNSNPQAKACFVGMDSASSREKLIRAVYEGIVFCHMEDVEKLLKSRGKPEVVRLAGGLREIEYLGTNILRRAGAANRSDRNRGIRRSRSGYGSLRSGRQIRQPRRGGTEYGEDQTSNQPQSWECRDLSEKIQVP